MKREKHCSLTRKKMYNFIFLSEYNSRFFIKNEDGSILESAQGYGFKSLDNAKNYARRQVRLGNPCYASLLTPEGQAAFVANIEIVKSDPLF